MMSFFYGRQVSNPAVNRVSCHRKKKKKEGGGTEGEQNMTTGVIVNERDKYVSTVQSSSDMYTYLYFYKITHPKIFSEG